MTSERKPLLLLFDGHGIIFRAYFALPPLTHSKTGEPVNAVQGFASMYLKSLEKLRPTHVAVAFDAPGKTFRDDMYADYKATRDATPEDLTAQIGRVHELVDSFGAPSYELPGYEADDVIGTLTHQAENEGIDTVVVTGDTDLLQLVTPKTKVLANRGMFSDTVLYDEEKVRERYGLEPGQLSDYRGLKGDSSDNIPGVPGVGAKTATKLLQEFGTLEAIYSRIDEVSPAKLKARMEEHHDQAVLSADLASIVREVPVRLDLDACSLERFDRQKAIEFFRMMELRSLAARLPGGDGGGQFDLFAPASVTDAADGSPEVVVRASGLERRYETIVSEDGLDALAERIKREGRVGLIVEIDGKSPVAAPIAGVALAIEPGESWYVPLGHAEDANLSLARFRDSIGPLLADLKIEKTFHNANHCMAALRQNGMEVAGLAGDTMLSAYLLGEKGLSLQALALIRLGIEVTPLLTLIGTGAKRRTMGQLSIEEAAEYACTEVDMTLRLDEALRPALDERDLRRLLNEVELPLVDSLVEMEYNGIALEGEILLRMSTEMAERLAELQSEIHSDAGHEFNINSTQQLGEVLYGELKITDKPPRTKTGYSTDAAALESFRELHPIVGKVLDYRGVTKLKSTYVDALPGLVDSATGRVHTWISATVAATGRLSSSDPNLQNIPVRTDEGRLIRTAFVARGPAAEDWQLLAADYSQIELRIAAHYSQDAAMMQAFRDDVDIHRATMALVRKKEPSEITADERRIAKAVNFGIIYGQGGFGLAQTTGLPRAEADEFIKEYFEQYQGIQRYIAETKELARSQGYVSTLLGRRRYLPDINSGNRMVRAAAERMAINMPLQGTAADVIKIAMIRILDRMHAERVRSKLLLQVHDELIFEVPAEEMEAMRSMVLEIMPAAMELAVPLKVDVKSGYNWGELD